MKYLNFLSDKHFNLTYVLGLVETSRRTGSVLTKTREAQRTVRIESLLVAVQVPVVISYKMVSITICLKLSATAFV